jgi:predicted dehydrogenase
MSDKKIRLAVIGTGPRWCGLASVYLQHPNLEIVALCDIADGLAENAAKDIHAICGNMPKFFTSY